MSSMLRLAALALIGAAPLSAQEAQEKKETEEKEEGGKWGIGILLNPTSLVLFDDATAFFLPIGFATFTIPIRASDKFTLEPEFGMFRSSQSSGSSGFSSSTKSNNLRLGVGALFGLRERGDMHPYVGARFGVIRSSSEDNSVFPGGSNSSTMKQTNTYLSAVLGGQYFFSRHFSLGGEIQLTRISFGDPDVTPPSSGTQSQSLMSTTGLMTMRLYF